MSRRCRTERDNVAHRRWNSCGRVKWKKHPDVEEMAGGRGCKRKKQIACTMCTESIRMLNKEEMWVVVEHD
jgi:radical SAM superfamily enzyme with C-terminal helix-hairpin-helix motif